MHLFVTVPLLEHANEAHVALLETLQRCHGDPTSFLFRVYQNAETRRLRRSVYNDLGDHAAKYENAIALLWRCRRLYCVFLDVLHYLRTQTDRLKDTVA